MSNSSTINLSLVNSYPEEISALPITPHLDEICNALKSSPSHFLILTAETAAGKSTAVPLALLKHFSHKIVMLEPRRLAAVAITNRVAHLLGEETGQTAGYRLHLESKISSLTRFEVMTEAILTRRLQNDPSLEGTDVVVIDEFHERSVHADLALAFLKESMQLRDDLFVIVMSATIDTQQLSSYLSQTVLHIPGRQFPVSIDYRPSVSPAQAVKQVIDLQIAQYKTENKTSINNRSLVNERLNSQQNRSILVFLPGIYDINRTKSDLTEALKQTNGSQNTIQKNCIAYDAYIIQILVLHSSIPFSEQKEVLQPISKDINLLPNSILTGNFKQPDLTPYPLIRVILSSAIAETSLTVPDVTTVIDSGLARINRFDAATGMEKLTTESESIFSAEQRAGRAGRTAPGTCIRLWTQNDVRVTRTPPEIMRTDLTPLVLECAQWGVTSPEKLSWLDTPPHSSWQNAHDLLVELGCITEDGHITQTGSDALSLGLHPRLACVALAGKKIGQEKNAAQIVIKFTEYARSLPERKKIFLEDLLRRLSLCQSQSGNARGADSPVSSSHLILLAGFPDRIARYAGSNMQASPQQSAHQTISQTQIARYQFPSGRIALLSKEDSEKSNTYPEWIVAPEADAGERTGKIYSYEVIPTNEALAWISERTKTITRTVFADLKNGTKATSSSLASISSGAGLKLQKFEYTCYGKIIIKEKKLVPSAQDFGDAVCSAVQENGITCLPLTQATERFLLRAEFYVEHISSPSQSALQNKLQLLSETPHEWLLPFLTGGSSNKIDGETVYNALYWYLGGQTIDRMVPEEITLPNGKKRRILYEKREKQTNDSSKMNGSTVIPVLEVIIQQIFGCLETPKILGFPVLLKLLSPARRPLQITDDLAGFWVNTWPEICKELKGRYPKHNWDYQITEKE
jgi:ATP-dependent helicase HrpB